MKTIIRSLSLLLLIILLTLGACSGPDVKKSAGQAPDKMQWWSEARFGMFIHFGLYSVLEGEWNGEVKYAEWIRNSAHIPLETYDTLVKHFNPVNFNADEWVRMAKDAGMKYLVITTKHHDGFCLFDSEFTDFDVMSTPFKRDIMAELATACHKQGIVLCFYHSIMDWHHPDYLPRRAWETNRPIGNADYNRYVTYLKNQLKELETKYGAIGVLWFDGEWESTWTHDRALDLYKYVIGFQPGIIVNNRIDTGRSGMAGMNSSKEFVGDFGTPEQEVPATGFPGTYWESCITLNNNWGYVKNDNNWKSSKVVIRMLTDIVSKGGNLLLNIGPKPDGTFPEQSIKILSETGEWMKKNSSSIYGTSASPFANLKWGRCTSKADGENAILYLHVFEWPADGNLIVPGIMNKVRGAYLLESGKKLKAKSNGTEVSISVPATCPDEKNTVVVLKIKGKPLVFDAPIADPVSGMFINGEKVTIGDIPAGLSVHYTLDGTEPAMNSPEYSAPIEISNTTGFKAAYFYKGHAIGRLTECSYTKVSPAPGLKLEKAEAGLNYVYCEGSFKGVPDFKTVKHTSEGIYPNVGVIPGSRAENFAQQLNGYLSIPADGVYTFSLTSDDGSKLFIDDAIVVDNDGFHSPVTKTGCIALGTGYHKLNVGFLQGTGDKILSMAVYGPQGELKLSNALVH
jgi:alpha-L-fucosidase